ncbi:conserved hypothetical protein [Ricinus communis]|uniref:Uncharacterized protein n=1 Tax=Ricinus communis TaxID=3988 RepID=B9SS26_RICCO|nr:conserved hypothetical protein [Ricinus communis]
MGVRQFQVAGLDITIHEHDSLCDSTTGSAYTGSWLWDSAIATSNIDFQRNLPGITSAKLGPSRVPLTDVFSVLLGLMKNVEENGLGDRVEVRELVWGLSEKGNGQFDVVLMSDGVWGGEERRVLAASEVRAWTSECLNELGMMGGSEMEGESGEGEAVFAVYCLIQLVAENCNVEDEHILI